MMSLSPGMSAGQAGGYFSREDYYLKGAEQGENSVWYGKGAEALGLQGTVGEDAFRALCRGEDPAGNRIVAPKLTRDKESGELVETRRAGNDCTFSAPKSVSIAYAAGVEVVKEAHDAAVVSVLGHMETHYSCYRTPEGINKGGMVAAVFDHATSRNIDPQLHSHVFIVNAVSAQDGTWKANEPKDIFKDQKSLGLLYRQALARELRQRGFEVVIEDRSQLFIKLNGIDPKLIEHFSSRREVIESQVDSWRSEGKFPGVPHARLYEMAALETRDTKRSVTKEEVTLSFERGFEHCGTSGEEVKRVLEMGREQHASLPVPGQEATQVVQLAARDLTEREAVLDRTRLLDQAVRISGGGHSLQELNAAIDGGTPGVLRLGQDARGREYYTTREMLKLEAQNLARIRSVGGFRSITNEAEVDGFLKRLAGEGMRLTAGQREEVLNEVTGNRGVLLTIGDPGTAKTSTLKVIERFNEEVLRPQGREHLSINLAYTGKAAREINLATGKSASTLDSFLSSASKFALQGEKGGPVRLEVGDEKVLIPQGESTQVVLRVDEAGFLGARQADHLLKVVEDLQGMGVQVKLHLLGDSKQMQGILAGNLLPQLQELGKRQVIDYTHLTEILRQRDLGLLEIARGLNREARPLGTNAREALLALEKRRSVTEIGDPDELRRAAVECYLQESRQLSRLPERAAVGELQQVLVVTTTNQARKSLNREIRSARVAAGEIETGASFTVLTPVGQGVTVEGYQLGDTVLFSGSRRGDGSMERWGARLNTEGKVTALDREHNCVQVTYSFSTRNRDGRSLSRTVTKEFSAADMAGRTTLYREEERDFAVGDRIVALKNDAKLNLQNGTLGVIKELDENGRALVVLGDRETVIDLKKYRQIEHAYAVTIHKSQGATVEQSILYAPVRTETEKGAMREMHAPSAEPFGRMSYNALNVAVTRAQFETHLFTNTLEGLARAVEVVDEKSSTLNKISEREPGGKLEHTEKTSELGRKIETLDQMVKASSGKPPLQPERDIPSPAPQRPQPEVAPGRKVVDRELELTLSKKF